MTMRTYRLSVERAEGALERVLGVVRRRGLGLHRLSVDQAGDGHWDIAITAAASESEAGLALRQFNALLDVRTARSE
ncbi:MAG: ACT domain-containing protein [Chloroflexi bacterium]|nr:ACT domain-containing protein [Chloroflexota bacterium]